MWTEEAHFRGFNTVIENRFGEKVALDGNTLAVSAIGQGGCATGIIDVVGDNGCPYAGAVYVFTRTSGVWSQQAFVKASNTGTDDQFGRALALSGDTLAVGTNLEDSCATGINGNQADNGCPDTGAVYVFTRSNNLWAQTAYVKRSPFITTHQGFAQSLALDGSTLAVGAGDKSCATGFNGQPSVTECWLSGAVYLFTRTPTGWAQQAYVKASNPDAWDFFGETVAIDGNTLVVGAPSEDSCATGVNGNQADNGCTGFPEPDVSFGHILGAGAVYVYVMQE